MTKIKKIEETPWVYILFKVDGAYYVDIPYFPKSGVEANMTIQLNEPEITKMINDKNWLSSFCKEIQNNYANYFPRISPINILEKYQNQERER